MAKFLHYLVEKEDTGEKIAYIGIPKGLNEEHVEMILNGVPFNIDYKSKAILESGIGLEYRNNMLNYIEKAGDLSRKDGSFNYSYFEKLMDFLCFCNDTNLYRISKGLATCSNYDVKYIYDSFGRLKKNKTKIGNSMKEWLLTILSCYGLEYDILTRGEGYLYRIPSQCTFKDCWEYLEEYKENHDNYTDFSVVNMICELYNTDINEIDKIKVVIPFKENIPSNEICKFLDACFDNWI